MHLSFASPWVDPRCTHGNRGEMAIVLVFLFSREGGELFSLGKDFARPWGHTHGICSRQWDRYGEKCFTWYQDRLAKMSKKRA